MGLLRKAFWFSCDVVSELVFLVHVAPGHEIVEMGLVKLYRISGKPEYLTTAKFFIDERGHYKGYDSTSTDPWKNGAYWQDSKPVVDQDEAVGHVLSWNVLEEDDWLGRHSGGYHRVCFVRAVL